jgi:putative FmdB family regulatory protein
MTPLYDFRCPECGYVAENHLTYQHIQYIDCPECGVEMHKKMGSVSHKFIGSGFHVNDYGKHPPGDDNGA